MADIIRMESDDVADVGEIWTRFVPSVTLEHLDPESFSFRWWSVTLEDVAFVRYSLTAGVQSRIQPEDQLFACRVVSPDGWVRSRQTTIDNGMPWATDGGQVEARWRGTADVSAIIFERGRAQELARRVTGDDLLSLRLTSLLPRTRMAARHWTRTFEHLISSAEAVENDATIESSLARHALITTLSCFASTYSDAILRDPHHAGGQTVRRAIAYIDECANQPITVDDVAEAAHISTRGLQYAFRRSLDTTPTEYLRRVRLDGAHRELRNGSPGDSVAPIARRWGFGNASRFSTLYRQTYGRAPRETLEGG